MHNWGHTSILPVGRLSGNIRREVRLHCFPTKSDSSRNSFSLPNPPSIHQIPPFFSGDSGLKELEHYFLCSLPKLRGRESILTGYIPQVNG